MKNLKKWMLVLCLAGPTVTNYACVSGLSRQFWNAAVAGAATWVEGTTFDLLDDNLSFDAADDE